MNSSICVRNNLVFQIAEGLICGPCTKNYRLILLNQLQIFWQWYFREVSGLLVGLGLLKLWHLIYSKLSTKCGMFTSLTNSNVLVFPVEYLVLFCLFSVIDDFVWLQMESICKSILVNAGVPQGSILGLYTLITFLMMLSTIFLSILMIIFSDLNVIRHPIYQAEVGSEFDSLLEDSVDWYRKLLIDSNAGKTQLFCLTSLIMVLMLKWLRLMLGLSFSSKLDSGSYIVFFA